MSSLKNNIKNRTDVGYENCIRVYGDSGKFSIFYSVCARFERERVREWRDTDVRDMKLGDDSRS